MQSATDARRSDECKVLKKKTPCTQHAESASARRVSYQESGVARISQDYMNVLSKISALRRSASVPSLIRVETKHFYGPCEKPRRKLRKSATTRDIRSGKGLRLCFTFLTCV